MNVDRELADIRVVWSEDADLGSLRQPLMVLALHGLFDAGKAATNAAVWLREHSESVQIGWFDPEELYNFSETRPLTTFDDDGGRRIVWPTLEVYACRTEGPRDLVVVVGLEPHYRWRAIADRLASVVDELDVSLVVTLGSTLVVAPHTRPARVVSSSGDIRLAAKLQLRLPTYEGPTGLVGVVNQTMERRRIPILSLRSEVPHYVPGAPSPKATQALLRRFEHLTSIPTTFADLDEWVQEWTRQVDQAVASDEESRVYLAQLESQVDSDATSLPSGDDLAGELEAFLRDLDTDQSDPD